MDSLNNFNVIMAGQPFNDRHDMAQVVKKLSSVLKPYYSAGKAGLYLGETMAHYDRAKRTMEAFSRQLWALGPLSLYDSSFETVLWQRTGLINGTDPHHSEYWGNLKTGDQRVVEMAAICTALHLNPDFWFYPLTPLQKSNLLNWLAQCNGLPIPQNNWVFFRILVNTTLRLLGGKPDEEQLQRDFARVEELYLGEGWYCDGDCNAIDYYVSFGIHYYSLIYVKLMKKYDAARCQLYTERALLFAKDFERYFADDGSAVAFGRSQTYRFAQAAFWSALAFADLEALPWGRIKGLVMRHLRWWFSKPIFSQEGILTIGYGYPGQFVTESYNAPGSPYWAYKSFLVLALPQSHPFWQASEQLPSDYGTFHLPYARTLINRQKQGAVTAFVVGQTTNNMGGMTHKYEKFVYSSRLAFNISRGTELAEIALDGTLAYSLDNGKHYQLRPSVSSFSTNAYYAYAEWGDRFITGCSYLIPIDCWHIRLHLITSVEDDIILAEGGFVIPSEQEHLNIEQHPLYQAIEQPDSLVVHSPLLSIAAKSYSGGQLQLVENLPHMNILHPKTKQSLVLQTLKQGQQLLARAFYLDSSSSRSNKPDPLCSLPTLNIDGNTCKISAKEFNISINLKK